MKNFCLKFVYLTQIYLLGANSPTPRTNLERYDSAFDPFRHQNSAATAPISLNNNSFGLGTGQQMAVLSKSPTPAELNGPKDTKNVEIAEVIVGAILGKYISVSKYNIVTVIKDL